ncbi:DUF2238 domain-containing protein [Pseudomonas izuensis]|uniref:DUF2238 domain-containing protein n=1 Tax=Pseudomonas izuensis TaxID=2684212 RepID=UPI0015B534BA|nr:DUF2238 domain-containing protein [Pseudomonas izuensis]
MAVSEPAIEKPASPTEAEAFVAIQKDIWDSQKDMALAFLGALICLALRAVLKFRH